MVVLKNFAETRKIKAEETSPNIISKQEHNTDFEALVYLKTREETDLKSTKK